MKHHWSKCFHCIISLTPVVPKLLCTSSHPGSSEELLMLGWAQSKAWTLELNNHPPAGL